MCTGIALEYVDTMRKVTTEVFEKKKDYAVDQASNPHTHFMPILLYTTTTAVACTSLQAICI